MQRTTLGRSSADRRAGRPRRAARAATLSLLLPAAGFAADRPVELRFAGEFDGTPFDCTATYEDVGAGATSVRVTDYRLFVSNVHLIDADGASVPVTLEQDGTWQSDAVALLDFEDAAGRCDNGTPETNASVRGSVPEGDYTGVAFDLGVPFELNHGDPTLQGSPLNLTAMFWSWQGGYRFLKLDTVPAMAMAPEKMKHGEMKHEEMADDAVAEKATGMAMRGHGAGHGASAGAWMLHVGSAGCASASRTHAPESADDCAAPNRVRVALDGIDVETDVIVVDPARVLAEADLGVNAPDTSPGCMSSPTDPDCDAVLPLLGIARGDAAAAEQRLFAVRRDVP